MSTRHPLYKHCGEEPPIKEHEKELLLMGWDVITGDASLAPSGASNEVILEVGKARRVRLLLKGDEQPYSFFQHTLEREKVGDNGQIEKLFRTVNCPKTKLNPYAPCPLCDGQQARRRVRHASRAYDYDTQSAKYLTGGEQIWKPIATLAKVGMDPNTVDWAIMRTGKDRNDTEYSATNMGPAQYIPTQEMYETLADPREEYKPHSEEEMKAIVEGMGLNWASLIVPPPIQYPPTLQDALNHVIPNTKYKGQTMEQVWNTNKGMIEFFSNSNRITPEKASAQVILVALGGAVIEGVPNYSLGNAGITNTPASTAGTNPNSNTTPNSSATNGGTVGTNVQQNVQPTGERQAKINEINGLLQTNKKFIDGGYKEIIDTMKLASSGKQMINDFTDAELDKMLELCKE